MATRGWWTVPVLMIALLCTGCSALDSNALSIRSHGYGDADLDALHIRAIRLVTAHDGRSVAVVGTFVNDGPADAKAGATTVGIIVDAPRDYLAPYAPPSTPPSTKPSPPPSTAPPNLAQRA